MENLKGFVKIKLLGKKEHYTAGIECQPNYEDLEKEVKTALKAIIGQMKINKLFAQGAKVPENQRTTTNRA